MSVLYLTAVLLISTAASTVAGYTTTSGGNTVTNIEFYFHDILSGSNPTAVQVIKPLSTSSSNFFGMVNVADDLLTETSDPKSKLIGRAQGLYASVGRNDIALLMALSYNFEEGPYKGSSLSIMGKNPAMNPTRELPVLGGTGLFRLARGYATLKTVSLNSAGDAVVHYNVTVYTPANNGSISPISIPGGGSSIRSSNAVDSSSSSSSTIKATTWVFGFVIVFICLFYAIYFWGETLP